MACPGALVLSRGLMRALAQLPLREGAHAADGGWVQWRNYGGQVLLPQLAVEELRLWLRTLWQLRGSALKRLLQAVAFVDACPTGYGVVATRVVPGQQRRFQVQDLRGGLWLEVCDTASTEFELRNIAQEVSQRRQEWRGCRVHVCTDNVGAAFIAGKGSQRNARMHAAALHLWAACLQCDVALSTQYLCGDGIIQSGADGLSRGADVYDCCLRPDAFAQLWAWRGPFGVDCCAAPGAVQRDPRTRRSLPYVSPYGGAQAVGTDVLTFCGDGRLYAFPPPLLIAQLLDHVLRSRLRMVVVVPHWPTQVWWPVVATCPQFKLGAVADVVIMGAAGRPHPFGCSFDESEALRVQLVAVAVHM